MGDFRIPTPIAVLAWAASGLAVIGYTYIAFKETSGGDEPTEAGLLSVKGGKQAANQLIAQLPELKPLKNETPAKPLLRGVFQRNK